MHRFLLTPLDKITDQGVFISSPDLLFQWTKVLKFRIGERVIVFDDSHNDYEVEIIELTPKAAAGKILKKTKNETEPRYKLTLAQGMLKNADKFELLLQKGTELGVSCFVPLLTDRTEQKFLHKVERLERILKEATEQSGRVQVPELTEIQKFKDIFKNQETLILVPHPDTQNTFKDIQAEIKSLPKELIVCIGPEGGFTDAEIAFAQESGAKIFNIGKRILRAETAAIVLPALVNQWLESL